MRRQHAELSLQRRMWLTLLGAASTRTRCVRRGTGRREDSLHPAVTRPDLGSSDRFATAMGFKPRYSIHTVPFSCLDKPLPSSRGSWGCAAWPSRLGGQRGKPSAFTPVSDSLSDMLQQCLCHGARRAAGRIGARGAPSHDRTSWSTVPPASPENKAVSLQTAGLCTGLKFNKTSTVTCNSLSGQPAASSLDRPGLQDLHRSLGLEVFSEFDSLVSS